MQENYNLQTKEIMEIIKTKRDVLEIGCGCGTESLWMSFNNANVYGIDVQKNKIKVCQERKKILEEKTGKKLSCTFENVSLFDFNSSKKFDVIWIEQAFHHVEPRKDFFNVAYNLLNDGGVIVFSESNAWNPLIQFGLFRLRGFKTIIKTEMNGQEVFIGNERVITAFALSRWLRNNGFSVSCIRYFRIFPNRSVFNKFASLERNFPKFLKPFFTHYNLVAIKK
jgi:2-polyprenyl-3-methyl-5-hydroxy-6-metoxy-1,4-benzoquinol methylase